MVHKYVEYGYYYIKFMVICYDYYGKIFTVKLDLSKLELMENSIYMRM